MRIENGKTRWYLRAQLILIPKGLEQIKYALELFNALKTTVVELAFALGALSFLVTEHVVRHLRAKAFVAEYVCARQEDRVQKDVSADWASQLITQFLVFLLR